MLLEKSQFHSDYATETLSGVVASIPTITPYSVVSLFSGCGGMDLGFQGGFQSNGKDYKSLPFLISWANDLNPYACATYKRNIGPHVHCGDIWKEMASLPSYADVVIGGFPCQDISINGKGLGVEGSRSGLYRAMVEVVDKLRPRVFVAENVKGLLMKHNQQSLQRVMSDFRALGYDVTIDLYKAAAFGVPQIRERVFIVGTLPGRPKFEPPKGFLERADWISSESVISDLENVPEDASVNHIWSRAQKSSDQGGRVLDAAKPSHTIRAECHGNIQFHYSLPRRISMREAARFQTFPDDFIFEARLRETERQIGNAVPPVLAWNIAKAVADCLRAG